MPPKIPQLKRQDATLREPKDQQEVHQNEAQAVPPTRPAVKKVWWEVLPQKDAQPGVDKKA